MLWLNFPFPPLCAFANVLPALSPPSPFCHHRPVNLLLVDVGRAAEAMLDDSVHLMCSAHLPGLFKQEELQSIIKSLKPVARAAGVQWSEIDRTGARCVICAGI